MLVSAPNGSAGVEVVVAGKPAIPIVVDQRGAGKSGQATLLAAGEWLARCIARAAGVAPQVITQPAPGPAIVVARADSYAKIAADAGLAEHLDAYSIVTRDDRVYLLGRTETAVQYAVADLLHQLGFRWYNPSPRWWIAPKLKQLRIDLNRSSAPTLTGRRIWYAYGVREATLKDGYRRWATANRLNIHGRFSTGHSYGHLIRRNLDEFNQHPEYFALLDDGSRDAKRVVNARKLCPSNPGLIELVIKDRIKLLDESRQRDPHAFMVSMDPSDGQGTCVCEPCSPTVLPFHRRYSSMSGLRALNACSHGVG